jgi:hypothetical protein
MFFCKEVKCEKLQSNNLENSSVVRSYLNWSFVYNFLLFNIAFNYHLINIKQINTYLLMAVLRLLTNIYVT